ncbi:protein translocase subunit SecD [Corynebacterium glucuronolyticum]|uniref:protein translocase subunit SecD n=1 Tax=Corynebacterium glucuronolyticum TaxID=39791 RepID=UPI003F6E325C
MACRGGFTLASQSERKAEPKARRTTDFVGRYPWGALGIFGIILILVYSLLFFTPGANTPKLGIDLQGGTRVTLVPQGGEPTPQQLDQARTILENRVNGMGVSGAEVVTDGNTLVITVPGEDTAQARNLGQTSQLVFRTVSQPAAPQVDQIMPTLTDMANRWVSYRLVTPEKANEVLKQYHDLLNQQAAQNGGEEAAPATGEAPTVTAEPLPEPKNSIEEQKRRDEVFDMMLKDRQSTEGATQMAAAALMECSEENTHDPIAGGDDLSKPLVACYPEMGQPLLLGPSPLLVGEPEDGRRLTGNEIDTNRPINGGINPQTAQNEVVFTFKSDNGETGSETWAKLTQEYLNKQVAVTLDSQIISAPQVQSATPVGSSTMITGMKNEEEAKTLANNLQYGALPLSFVGENGERGGTTTVIPPTLGAASLRAGLIAGLIGLLAVAVFSLVNYRLYGLLAMFTLVASGTLVYGSLVLLGRWIGYSLDLAGVAGLIIGIGTTADSFVVLYERIKDEIRDGRTFRSAVPRGWDRARKTIISGNFVSVIAAVVLYILAVGDVKGFAFTLGLTTVFDLAVTFFVTAPLVILASRKKFFAKASVNGLGKVYELVEQRRAAGEQLAADTGWYNQRMLAKRNAGATDGESVSDEDGNIESTATSEAPESNMIADDRPSSLITLEESIANEPKVPEHLRAPLLDDGSPDGSHIVNQEEK